MEMFCAALECRRSALTTMTPYSSTNFYCPLWIQSPPALSTTHVNLIIPLKTSAQTKYALIDRQLDGSYGHQWKPSTPMEHLVFDGIVFENNSKNIHDSWCDDNLLGGYNPTIAGAMHHHRFLEIRCPKVTFTTRFRFHLNLK
jgi:hypothetical protein